MSSSDESSSSGSESSDASISSPSSEEEEVTSSSSSSSPSSALAKRKRRSITSSSTSSADKIALPSADDLLSGAGNMPAFLKKKEVEREVASLQRDSKKRRVVPRSGDAAVANLGQFRRHDFKVRTKNIRGMKDWAYRRGNGSSDVYTNAGRDEAAKRVHERRARRKKWHDDW